LERAFLLELHGSLRRIQRRFDDSLRFLRRAEEIYQELEESNAVSRCQIQVSIVHHFQGELDISIAGLRRAISLIDPALEPRSLFFAWHNLIDAKVTAGHSILESQALLARARPLYKSFPKPWAQGRLKWIEGRIARQTGRPLEAMAYFSAARQDLLTANLSYEADMVAAEMQSGAPLG
jgi:tetratricopeptide (TPR) repeat protein